MAAKAKAKAAKASGESVLLEEAHLHQAFKEVTRGGRQNLHGIYTPKGRIPDNAEAEENQNLAKVADKYKAKKKQVKQKAKEAKKSETEFEDERVSKKAAKILSKASEVEKSQYQEIFNYFDADEDACWGSIELAQRMTDLGYATSVEAASNLLYFAGVRDVDRITYEDFITMMPKLQAFRKLMEKDFMCHFQRKVWIWRMMGQVTSAVGSCRRCSFSWLGRRPLMRHRWQKFSRSRIPHAKVV